MIRGTAAVWKILAFCVGALGLFAAIATSLLINDRTCLPTTVSLSIIGFMLCSPILVIHSKPSWPRERLPMPLAVVVSVVFATALKSLPPESHHGLDISSVIAAGLAVFIDLIVALPLLVAFVWSVAFGKTG